MPGWRGRAGSGGRDRGLLAGKRGAIRSVGHEAGWDGRGRSALPLPRARGASASLRRAGRGGPGGAWAEAPEKQPLPSPGPRRLLLLFRRVVLYFFHDLICYRAVQ